VSAFHLYQPSGMMQLSAPELPGSGGPMICSMSLADAQKFAEALTSLGASLRLVDHNEPVLMGYCAANKR
jgi:hypothetical protein